MEKSCSTCRYCVGEGSFCGGTGDCWEPKESGIHAAREDIDHASTAFTDKLRGERTLERSCVTCNKDVSSDCAECGDAYYLWEPIPSLTAFTDKLKGERTLERSCETCGCDLGETGQCGRYCGGRYCGKDYSGWVPKTAVPEHEISEEAPCGRCSRSSNGSPADMQVCPPCLQRTGYKNFLAASDPFGPYSETPALTGTQKKISEICDEVKTILIEKNRKYGDSAINPKRVFSKASPIEQINVRIDDKISRIMSAQDDDTEDAELDLIGYLILKRVAKKVFHDVQ